SVGRPIRLRRPLYSTSSTSVDLPEPLTPVTQTSLPSGRRTSTSRKLCSLAPCTSSQPADGTAGADGVRPGFRDFEVVIPESRPDTKSRPDTIRDTVRSPRRYWAVREVVSRRRSAGVPLKTIWPPALP